MNRREFKAISAYFNYDIAKKIESLERVLDKYLKDIFKKHNLNQLQYRRVKKIALRYIIERTIPDTINGIAKEVESSNRELLNSAGKKNKATIYYTTPT